MKVFTICAFAALAISGTQAATSETDDFGTPARGRALRTSPAFAPRPKRAPAPAPALAPKQAPVPAPAPEREDEHEHQHAHQHEHEHEHAPEPAPAPAPEPAAGPGVGSGAGPTPALIVTPTPSPVPGQARDLPVPGINYSPGITPAAVGKEGKKDCQQTACYISTATQGCGMLVADQLQRQLMNGRDTYAVESTTAQGIWVRYWRTQFNPPDRGDIASGACSDGTPFTVTNCQATGNVKC